jgi:hypothetical protein
MAVSFVSNALGATNSTTSFSVSLPTTAAGDILILEFTHRGTGDGTIGGTSVTSGGLTWNIKHSQLYATSTFSGKTYWTRATGNHSGQTVTGSGLTNSCAAIVTVYRGALASGDPLADATIVGEDNASGNETQAQITTATAGSWVVLVVANSPDVDVTSQTCTSPGALTARAERLSTGGTDTAIAHASAEKATAGATGSFTWAQTDGISGSWAYAIKPAPVTHTNTGTPTAGSATVAGTATHLTLHATSGALTAGSAVVAGTAAHPVPSTGDSVRVDTASLISGKLVVGDRGLGVLGSTIPSTGEHGAALLYNDLDLPTEDNDEFRALITTWPVGLTLFVNEDSSFEASGADGEYVGEYEGFKNGVSYGTAEFTVTIGAASTHATSGALVSDAATVAGTATHLTLHATSGALEAGSATVAGTAAHQHVATGAIEAAAATVAGSAAHLTLHTSSGALEAQAATASGAAAHQHASNGDLSASAATVAGTADHRTLHATSGALTASAATASGTAAHEHAATGTVAAQAATVSGEAVHLTPHATSGALAAQAAAVAGAAAHEHAATGALAAAAATVEGSASHLTLHATSGALEAQAAAVDGDAEQAAAGTHDTTGELAADSATVEGEAAHKALHTTSGALVAGSASVEGSSARAGGHVTEGNLSAQAAQVVGAATRLALHTTTGDLEAGSATVAGSAARFVAGGLSPKHAAWLEALARLHGLIDPLTVSATQRSDGTVVQTVEQAGAAVTVTTQSAPSGDDGTSALTEEQAGWLEALVRLHGLIEPLTVTTSARGDGTLAQTIETAGGTTTVTRTA